MTQTIYTLRTDSVEALERAGEKQADCHERFYNVKVEPAGLNKINIICTNEKKIN